MSKRCKLQKEYYKEFGNYKGSGKYTDHYVSFLETKVLEKEFYREARRIDQLEKRLLSK